MTNATFTLMHIFTCVSMKNQLCHISHNLRTYNCATYTYNHCSYTVSMPKSCFKLPYYVSNSTCNNRASISNTSPSQSSISKVTTESYSSYSISQSSLPSYCHVAAKTSTNPTLIPPMDDIFAQCRPICNR